ncbi:MAG TPA: hypothetical protein PKZ60_04055 [Candidatus Saccharicenans sp.]|nr:hypothetical protein [Candidatus Saccharicenans sp.]
MIVTAYNNGQHHSSGAGYGLRLSVKDRDKYFKRDWKEILLRLEGEEGEVLVNVSKPSFWNSSCRELISKGIGIWLIKNGKVPWPKGCPPKMRMEHLVDNIFKLEFL